MCFLHIKNINLEQYYLIDVHIIVTNQTYVVM